MKSLLSIVLLILCTSSANAALSFLEYKTLNQQEDSSELLRLVISTMGQSYTYANLIAEKKAGAKFFCPDTLEPNTEPDYQAIVAQEIIEHRKRSATGYPDSFPLGLILLNGLLHTFSCEAAD